MKLNPIGIIGGIILIISPFLAWVSVFFFNISLLDMALTGDMVSILILILLIVGGIIALFKGLIGGIIGLVGVLAFTIIALTASTYGIPADMIFQVLGIGYYLAWIGAIICIISIVWKRIAPAPPTPVPPPPPT
ncbi:MAG: hypothetical protein QXD82_04375 [Nitrososphaerales archaeon]